MNNYNLTHLLFVDDILIFVEEKDEYLRNMQYVIHLFEEATCLNINLSKYMLSPINVTSDRVN